MLMRIVLPLLLCFLQPLFCQQDLTIENQSIDLLISQKEIKQKIKEIAIQLDQEYAQKDLVLVMILKGSFCFVADLIREIKRIGQYPTAIITNGALLYLPEVREDLLEADAVMPSLDAGTEKLYRHINRALPELTL